MSFPVAPDCLAQFLGNCSCNCRTRVQHLQLTRGHGHDTAARSGYCCGRSDRSSDRPVREFRHLWRRTVDCDNLFGLVLEPVRIAVAIHIYKATSISHCAFSGVERLSCSLRCMVRLSDTVARTFLELSMVNGKQSVQSKPRVARFLNLMPFVAVQ